MTGEFTKENLNDCFEQIDGMTHPPPDAFEKKMDHLLERHLKPALSAVDAELFAIKYRLFGEAVKSGHVRVYVCAAGHETVAYSVDPDTKFYCGNEDECGWDVPTTLKGPCEGINYEDARYCSGMHAFHENCLKDPEYKAAWLYANALNGTRAQLETDRWNHYSKRQQPSKKHPDAGKLLPGVVLMSQDLYDDIMKQEQK